MIPDDQGLVQRRLSTGPSLGGLPLRRLGAVLSIAREPEAMTCHVCKYVCMYVCMYVYAYAYAYISIYIFLHVSHVTITRSV